MKSFLSSIVTLTASAALLAGCSSDGGMLGSSLTTSSVDATKTAPAPKLDPACIALTAKIDALRKDGVTERVEKASAGKSTTVSVKRESLAKMTELDRANSDYQSKCSVPGLAKPMPVAPAAAAAAPAANTKVTNVAPAVAKPAAAKKTVAVTAAAPAPAVAPAAEAVPVAAPVAAVAAPAMPAVTAPIAAAPMAGVAIANPAAQVAAPVAATTP